VTNFLKVLVTSSPRRSSHRRALVNVATFHQKSCGCIENVLTR